ncbi:MAG: InlB B-repeat-containing protein [Lachnospiraceae bacterium]|nr:InlB B-repeat-containing protein [Lachnospiraceae bacterium]
MYGVHHGADIAVNDTVFRFVVLLVCTEFGLYYGDYYLTDYNTKEPTPWYILNNSANNLLIMTEYIHELVMFADFGDTDNEYNHSYVKAYLEENYIENGFLPKERDALITNNIEETEEIVPEMDTTGADAANADVVNSAVTGGKLYIPSTSEITNIEYGFWRDRDGKGSKSVVAKLAPAILTTKIGNAIYGGNYIGGCNFWLRTRASDRPSNFIGAVNGVGNYAHRLTRVGEYSLGPRPVGRINENIILFTTLATNGKPQEVIGTKAPSAPTENADQGYSEWVLTMKDPDQTITVSTATVSGDGKSMTIPYSGATVGDNQYISVYITDKDGKQLLNYGKLAETDPSGSGTVTLTFPEGFDRENMKVFIMSENDRGDYETSFASAVPVEVPVIYVHYDTVGGTMTDPTDITATPGFMAPNPTPTLEDHEFKGWYTTPDYADGTKFDFTQPIMTDTTLYAKWFPDQYSITFDANGGNGIMDTIYHDGKTPVDLLANTFIRDDYEFTGWNTAADGSGTTITDKQAAYEPGKKNTVLYAQWKKITYTVKYDTNGATPAAIADKTGLDFDSASLLPTDVLAREGFTFTGWKVKGEETVATESSKYSDLVKDKTVREVTLQAQWSENAYTVKYDTNGGNPTAITDKTNVKFKDAGLLPADEPTRAGYTFEGWEVDGKKVTDTTAYKALVADDTVKSVTLVAQWKEKEYTVKYDSNGGNPVTIADKEHVKFWDSDLLPADAMTKSGYTFGGWNYKTVSVSATSKYSDLAADDKVKEITLVAQWVPKQYQVNYDVNGGEPNNYPSETVGFETIVPIPANAPTRAGYDFKGWLKDATKIDGTSVTYDSLVADDTVSEITLVAQWVEKSYTVKFELKPGERGGTLDGDTADQSVKYNQHATAGADVSASVGSAFLGWSYSYTPVGSTTPISGTVMDYTTVPILNDVTFIANFAKVPFVSGISTNGYVSVQKGGALTDAGTETITKIEYDLTDTLPGEAGFKFEGVLHYHINEIKFHDLYNHEFTLDLNSTERQEFTVGEDGHTSNIQITVDKANGTVHITGIEESLKFNFAFAEDTKYTVSFKEEKDATDNWGQNKDLYTGDAMGNAPATNPVKPGYAFGGWSSDGSNSSDKMYDPDATIQDKDEVYYAVWTPKEYTVHYNTDGGTTVPDKTGVHYTDTGLTPADNPTKPGYTFAGWEKDTIKIGADTAYNTLVADDTVMEVTLTAKWEIKHFTASWVTKNGETLGSIDGGNQTEEGIAYNGNTTKDVTVTPASNDSEFIGWDYSYIPDGSTTPVTGFTNDYKTIPVLGDITFTAKFAAKPFVSIGATNGKVTAAKGTTPEEISGSSGTTALVQYTAADDIANNKGTVSLKYAADMHHHLSTISFKDMLGHEYTIWTKDGGGTTAGPDYEVGSNTPATKVQVVIDETTGVIQVSNIDTSLAFTVVFEKDPTYKVEFFRDKADPASLMQTNDGLYTGNPVGAKPDPDPTKPGYKFLGWSTDGSKDTDKMYDKDTLIADADIAYYGVWELIDYKLTISKTVDGEHGNQTQDFHFIITLKDKDGTPLSGTYSYTGAAIAGVRKPGDGTVTLDGEGRAEITLKHGQSIVLDGLHIEEQYTVVEKESNQNGYITTATGDSNTNITGDSVAAFTNTRTTTPPTGIGPMSHLPTMILGVVILLLTCAGLLWARRRRRA